ncbi:MAG: antibiotic biosynthesis monooxygenase [Bacteroidales bacterium]|nr:antibiotic biosynthesis monooxygenase [Bacteroidales bacterium]
MIVTCVYVHVKSDAVDKFINETITNHRKTVQEPGNLRFDFIQQADDPCSFMLYEVFEDEKAVADHKETSHYLTWRDNVANLMAETRKGVRYKIIEPSDRTRW